MCCCLCVNSRLLPFSGATDGRFTQQPFGFGGGGFRARRQREPTAEERAEMERQAEEFRQAARTVAKEVGKAVMGAAARAAARAARNAASKPCRIGGYGNRRWGRSRSSLVTSLGIHNQVGN